MTIRFYPSAFVTAYREAKLDKGPGPHLLWPWLVVTRGTPMSHDGERLNLTTWVIERWNGSAWVPAHHPVVTFQLFAPGHWRQAWLMYRRRKAPVIYYWPSVQQLWPNL